MTTYDVTPDDEPLDARAIGADDLLVEQLRHAMSPDAAVVWDDDDDEIDPAFALLRALQLDVSADLPSERILPDGVTELFPRRRRLGRGATIAAVTAGVLSIAGVAAASAPGQPLAGVRHAVSNAVSTAVHAITPDAPVGPAVAPTSTPSAKATPPGDAVSAAARSASAILQIQANLDRAAGLLDKGRYEPAKAQLDAAARKLDYVTDAAARAGLQSRLTALQARLAATPHVAPSPGKPDGTGKPDGNNGNGGQGGDATHSPKPVPTRSARSTGSTVHVSGDATPSSVETPNSHQGSGS